MSWNRFLTNQLVLLCVLLIVSAMPIILNSVFLLTSAVRSFEYSIFVFLWLEVIWLLLVAAQLDLFKLKKYTRLVSVTAVAIAILNFLLNFWIVPTHFSGSETEFAQVGVVVGLSILFTLVATLADRISESLLGRVAIFFGLLNWPIFLFVFSDRLKGAIERAAESEER